MELYLEGTSVLETQLGGLTNIGLYRQRLEDCQRMAAIFAEHHCDSLASKFA